MATCSTCVVHCRLQMGDRGSEVSIKMFVVRDG